MLISTINPTPQSIIYGDTTSRVVVFRSIGKDNRIYSGSGYRTIRVWSGADGAHLQTLKGHAESIYALAVGKDGRIYSGSRDNTIRVWSGTDGTHLHTLEGFVRCLAIGQDGRIYSKTNQTIQRW